jgi:hypothetical protein
MGRGDLGTYERPIVIRSDGMPCKYQCPVCEKWYVESEFALMGREMDYQTLPRCQSCKSATEEAAWKASRCAEAVEWEKVTKE